MRGVPEVTTGGGKHGTSDYKSNNPSRSMPIANTNWTVACIIVIIITNVIIGGIGKDVVRRNLTIAHFSDIYYYLVFCKTEIK